MSAPRGIHAEKKRPAHLLGEVERVGDGDGERNFVAEEEAGLMGHLQDVVSGEDEPVAVEGIVVAELDHVGASLQRSG